MRHYALNFGRILSYDDVLFGSLLLESPTTTRPRTSPRAIRVRVGIHKFRMEALGVFALQMKSPPLHQVCMRCYRSLFRTGTISRALQTNVANRQMCTSETSIKPVDQPLTGSRLSNRSLVLVKGRDASDLLQGLMTNDMQQLDEGKGQEVIYSMFLNKQGRVLYDVMCYQWSKDPDEGMQSYILECDSAISQELQKHLKIYRIRKKVDITSLDSEYDVWSVFSPCPTPPSPGSESSPSHFFPDPRVQGLGQRVIVPQGSQVSDVNEVSQEDYMTHRYQWGVAEGVNELPPGDCLPLEANLALMNGVSFTKGCYLGQELTARTHHTGVIRKRVMPIHFTGNAAPTIPAGTSIKSEEGKNVGKLRCHLHQNGLALLRTALIGSKLKVTTEDGGEADLEARRPSWWPKDS